MITVDPALPDPPYDQVKQQIAALVRDGTLGPGDKLPTVRRLAAELGLAANTVARAYRELEAVGVLDTRGRSGTFVSGDEVRRAAREAAVEYVERMRSLGLAPADALGLVSDALVGRPSSDRA